MNCPICGHEDHWLIPHLRDDLTTKLLIEQKLSADYQWFLCKQCGNGFQSIKSNRDVLRRIWQANRLLDQYGSARQNEIIDLRIKGARRGALRAYNIYSEILGLQKGAMLDVGCGLGELVKVYQDHQWEAFGVDPDPTTKEFHNKLGIKTTISQIEDVSLQKTYDAVFTTHSIYFISQPVDFLKSLKKFIKPDGYLCVAIANFFANNDTGLPGYAHTFYPSHQSMIYLLALAGYKTIFTRSARGSIYLAAKADASVTPGAVNTFAIYMLYRTKKIRYWLFGMPAGKVRNLLSRVISKISGF